LLGRPKYTGNFRDALGNRLTVLAAANPVQSNREPGLIYDRATGYGMVTFDKTDRSMQVECWPRYVDPKANPEGQYDGWPVVIRQQENYGREAVAHLPEIRVEGMVDPVVQLFEQQTGDLVYALRINGQTFRPKVFDKEGRYTLRIGEPDQDRWQEFEDISPADTKPIISKFK
jgi:hypothetical protein